METSYSEKLARYKINLITICLVGAACWLFRNVLVYIILAALLALLAVPISSRINRIRFGSRKCPVWVGTIISLVIVVGVSLALVSTIIPLFVSVARDISTIDVNNITHKGLAGPLSAINKWIMNVMPSVGKNFRIETLIVGKLPAFLGAGHVSSVVESVGASLAKTGVAVFSVVFISFFFIKDPALFNKIVLALVPDKYEPRVKTSLEEIHTLISRYFIGLVIETLGVTLFDFLGLLLIAGLGFKYSLGIAFMLGVLNIIPYIGPLIGDIIGICLGLVINYACVTSYGLDVSPLTFTLVLYAIFQVTQFIDGLVLQPLIFSNSVKVHPLEIFIVFIVAGSIGGMFGMVAAIPAYTVLRVVAKEFLSNLKPVRRLTSDRQNN